MQKLSANRAAKEAGVAKKTLLEALISGRMSAGKNDKGHWEIDPAELFRVFPQNTVDNSSSELFPTHHKKHDKTPENSALAVEVKMLREQIETLNSERNRERQQLSDQIEDLRDRLTHSQGEVTKLLQDQRSQPVQGRGFTLWPFGRKTA